MTVTSAQTLASQLVAVPESRERETLSLLLRNRGIPVLEVPLVAIVDAPDPEPVHQWLLRFIAEPVDLFVILTGEGLRRLLSFSDRVGLKTGFVAKLAQTATVVRGPKPEKALSEVGLKPTHKALVPTSAGVLAVLQGLNLMGKRVALQLYSTEPNTMLVDAITNAGGHVDQVAPYVYASQQDEDKVASFIGQLARSEVALLAFTSQSQFQRLRDVADKRSLQAELAVGLNKTALAAVGPVVKDQLEAAGYQVALMPERMYFMKPLVTEIVRYLEARGKA